MSVELPKDAEGREIPLDTVAMFNRNGDVYNIMRWVFSTDLNTDKEWANSWHAVEKNGLYHDPELMYLTPPDSWEKLDEDLAKAATNNGNDAECNYFGLPSCTKECPAWNKCCSVAFAENILSRIRKLRGED